MHDASVAFHAVHEDVVSVLASHSDAVSQARPRRPLALSRYRSRWTCVLGHTLPPSPTRQVDQVVVTISCDGDDPLIPNPPGVPFPTNSDWPTETLLVNVSTSEGNNPLDPKPTVGIFKKEGLPPGNCRVRPHAVSNDGNTTCDGHMDGQFGATLRYSGEYPSL